MAEKENFVQIGDHRDIPLSLGLSAITWNSCESHMSQLLRHMISAGSRGKDHDLWRRIEVVVVELGTTGLLNAIHCLCDEIPPDHAPMSAAIRHGTAAFERYRAYRNYYVHGITGVTRYGIMWSKELFENDAPVHEAIVEGPFGQVYMKTAKGKSKFHNEYLDRETLINFSNGLADLNKYLSQVEASFLHYIRGEDYQKSAPLPQQLPLPDTLTKPVFDHPKLRLRYALAPLAKRRSRKAAQD